VNQNEGSGPEFRAVVSGLRFACWSGDAEGVRAGLSDLFRCLEQFERESLVTDRSSRVLAAAWLLTKCAENLRELEWQLTSKQDDATRTADLADRCVVQMSEAVGV
jgi:hypothetical protein